MLFRKRPSYFKNIEKCNLNEKKSLSNLIAFPKPVCDDLLADIYQPSDNHIVEMFLKDTDLIIGGYVARLIPAYQIIFLKHLIVNPTLKSKIYGQEMLQRIADFGLASYGANFKGIIAINQLKNHKKNFKKQDEYKVQSIMNYSSNFLIDQSSRNSFHFIYVRFNEGYDAQESKEVFEHLLQTILK